MNQLLLGTYLSATFLVFLIVIEFATRRFGFATEITRSIIHLFSCLFAILMGLLLREQIFVFFSLLFLLIIGFSYKKNFFSAIHNVKRSTLGELFLPIGILFSYLINGGFGKFFIATMLILAISDPLAGSVGRKFKDKQFKLLGSLAFLLSTFILLAVNLAEAQLFPLLSLALVLAVVEKVSPRGSDNLTLPVFTALIFKTFF